MVIPLLVGFTDGTVDPTKLAHIPITQRELTTGLLVAGLLGIMPIVTLGSVLSLLSLAPSVLAGAVISVQVVMLVVLCVLVSQVGSAALTGLVKGRKGRDVAVVILSLGSTAVAVGLQTSVEMGVDVRLSQVEQFSRVAVYTPGGWLGWGISQAVEGRLWPGVGVSIASVGLATGLIMVWGRLLDLILTQPDSQIGNAKHHRGQKETWKDFRVLRFIPSEDIKASVTRTLITARRDPRALMSMAGQVPLLLVLTLPALPLLIERHHLSVLSAGTLGFYGAMLNTNLFGFDGRGVWVDLLSAPSMRSVLWGKTIAHGLVVAPLFLVVVLSLAGWTGGWEFVIPTIGLAVVWYGAAAGIQVITSVMSPIPAPDRSVPWEGNGSGAGMASAFTLMFSVFAAMILAVPGATLIGGLSVWSSLAATIATPFAMAYGVGVWYLGIRAAMKRADEEPWRIFGPLASTE